MWTICLPADSQESSSKVPMLIKILDLATITLEDKVMLNRSLSNMANILALGSPKG